MSPLRCSEQQFALFETFANPNPAAPYTIYIEQPEFTSQCPKTGQPDFGTIRIWYQPGERCVELKSLKMYFQEYRGQGIFYEAVTNQITNDLEALLRPGWLMVESDWRPRGGISTKVIVERGRKG